MTVTESVMCANQVGVELDGGFKPANRVVVAFGKTISIGQASRCKARCRRYLDHSLERGDRRAVVAGVMKQYPKWLSADSKAGSMAIAC